MKSSTQKIYGLLSVMLVILIPELRSQNCGTSYALPSGSTHPQSVAFSPNSSYLATANLNSNTITMFSVMAGGTLSGGTSYTLPSGSSSPVWVAFSSNGSYLATANTDSVGDVTIFNVGAGGILSGGTSYVLPSGAGIPSSVAFSPDGSYLAVATAASGASSGGVTIFSVGSGGSLSGGTFYTVPSGSLNPVVVVFSSNGLYLATANNGSQPSNPGDVTIFTVGTGGVLSGGASYSLPATSEYPYSVVFSPNGLYLATANGGCLGCASSDPGDVTIFTVGAGSLGGKTSYALPVAASSAEAFSVDFSPNGSYLAVANYYSSGNLIIFSVGTGGTLTSGVSYTLPSGSAGPYSVVFSPNGLYIATANAGSNDVTLFTTACLGIVASTTGGSSTTGTVSQSSRLESMLIGVLEHFGLINYHGSAPTA
jgi:6-phosphogluconolactonase (cycloisomerase 2 family)